MENKLEKQLTSRHITMLALGGAIGAGLFKGAGEAIGIAGPAVMIAFLLGGIILFIVMKGLGRLVLHQEQHNSGLSGLIEPLLGGRAAHFTDWVYWSLWMINIIAEAVAAGSFLQLWFPHTPVWLFVLLIALLTTMINLYSVRLFAETEYWLAFAKISVIILLILFGGYLVIQQFFETGPQAFAQLTANGGFAPHGLKGLMNAMLVVIYSYGGSELIAITVSETADPKKAIPKAIKGVMGRIVSFYLLPLFLLMVIYPWQTLAHTSVSPFVMVFQKMHIPFATDIVNFVIVLALFSSINSGVYASSRTLYFRLKDRTDGPAQALTKLNGHRVPQRAVLFCTGTLYIGVVFSYFLGNDLFNYLVGSLSYSVLLIWLLISFAAWRLAQQQGQKLQLAIGSLAILALLIILCGIFATNNLVVTLVTAGLYGVILLSYRTAPILKQA